MVEEAVKPEPFSREVSKKISSKKRRMVLEEFSGRHGDYNVGGSTRKKLVTVYREAAIHIGALLNSHGPLAVKQLKTMGTDPDKTSKILQDNHYGWFQRISRGVYSITDQGITEINEYKELMDYYLNR